jgi:fused signal recognition particle receptor
VLSTGAIAFIVIIVLAALVVVVATRRAQRGELADRERQEKLPPPEQQKPKKELPPAKVEAPEKEEKEEEEEEGEEERKAAYKAGLQKTRGGFVAKLASLFKGKQIDASTMDHLEEVLLTADIGVKTSQKIFESLKKELSKDELTDEKKIWASIRAQSHNILDVGAAPLDLDRAKPLVILMIGVNGVGKTTTIGKLASKYTAAGKKVLLAAGDTFRAAATEQLVVWGDRTSTPVVKGKEGGDPSSVIFDAVKKAQAEGYDVVLADTAGRLHTKTNLMDELQKVRRVTQKAMETAPHETFLVLDSTTGQNAIEQARLFQQAMQISGIVMTKLDGTAKGGVILGICDELKVPVRYIGIGEKVEDLREFDVDDFVAALYDEAEPAAA